MTTLVTGATGFVGSALLRLLLAQQYDVRVLVRPASDQRNIRGLKVEIVEGDLTDFVSLKRALRGCKSLFHVAADYRLWVPDPDKMYQANVEGTRQLMLAAMEAGVQRIVYTSSVATLGLHDDGTPADETTPRRLEAMIGHYKRSKYLAEQAVLDLIHTRQLPAVIVHPSTPLGPRDIKPTPTGRIILDTLRHRMPAYVDTGLNIVHVDDVAQGHLLALQKGDIGEHYILGGDNLSLQAILCLVCRHAHIRPPVLRIPHNLVLPVAWVMEKISLVTGREPRVAMDSVKMSKRKMFFSSNKAKKALGYRARPVAEGIVDAIAWFEAHHYL